LYPINFIILRIKIRPNPKPELIAEANRRWREPFSPYPKIYPSETECDYAPPRAKLLLTEAFKFDTVRGLNSREGLTTLYLVNQTRHSELPLAYPLGKPRRAHLIPCLF